MSKYADRLYLLGHKSTEIEKTNSIFGYQCYYLLSMSYCPRNSEWKGAVTMTEMINDRRGISNSIE